ncbi:MAG: DUF4254 domain-containing protein [bacterium]|nr:DUF4254 domain-containing protein [candidate division KSB1 bacterium]MDH7560075.1 DUF4254 domain-containing protein [bacterium]
MRRISALIDAEGVQELVQLLDAWTGRWHQECPNMPAKPDGLLELLQALHVCNFSLWHEEDEARRPDVADAVIVAHKRAIDHWNQRRNDTIEQLDGHLLAALQRLGVRPHSGATQNSETPGSILDRLSIASLKIYHMAEQARREDAGPGHRAACEGRRAVLQEQRDDLIVSLERLLKEILAGEKRLKLYRQFKMYNDPALNPALYGAGKGSTKDPQSE